MAATQQNRFLAIGTALGDDALLIKDFSMTEQVGRLFQMDVELTSADGAVDFDAMVGSNATVRLEMPGGKTRYFNGFVSRFVQIEHKGATASYRATLVPWLWFLTRTADCRIFQKKKAPDIIEEVFKAHGFKDYKLKLSGTYREWEYCVQYRETDFNFVSRLMEQEGIYYYCTHEDGLHVVNLADAAAAHEAFEDYATMIYRPRTKQDAETAETITDWVIEKEVQPGVYALSDFNFKTPASPIVVNADVSRNHPAAAFEIYDYPGEFEKRDEGEAYAKVRIQELQAQHEILRAETTVRGACPGAKFTLDRHPRDDQNREYLITGASYRATVTDYGSGAAGKSDEFFSCSFTAIPASEPYRSARLTPKPVIQGPQTAVVVGTKGEEIDTDEFGRVKVQFHWDRYGKVDENSSCWVRVSQGLAGKSWGAISIPRIGQEVIVEFLEGDPDRPIITGRVYNAVAKVPYALPANKTMSTLKSNSSKGGQGFNEMRIEDKKGEEQIFIHGEKDLDLRVKNDAKEWIGHDRHLVVKNDQVELVENDRQEKIKRDHVEEIGRDRHTKISGKEAIEVVETLSLKVTDDVGVDLGKNLHTKVAKDVLIEATNIVLKASENITFKIGEDEVYISMDKKGIKLSAASGEIVLEAKDITEKATANFKVEATSEASIKGTAGLKLESPATAELKSAQTTVKGDAMLTLKGGVTMIN